MVFRYYFGAALLARVIFAHGTCSSRLEYQRLAYTSDRDQVAPYTFGLLVLHLV